LTILIITNPLQLQRDKECSTILPQLRIARSDPLTERERMLLKQSVKTEYRNYNASCIVIECPSITRRKRL